MNKKIFIAAIIALFIDQLSKVLISIFFHVGEQFVVIKSFFSIYFIENYGAAWSLFSTKGEFNLAFGFIIGGIFGNLIDRFCLGYVRDFLAFRIFHYDYPVFNFADSFIVIGVFLLIVAVIRGENKNETN